jgi:hypothetical protein
MGYVRQGFADPYEVNVDLPAGAMLNLKQYEFLMNALDLLYPIGVNIGTYSIRQGRVDLNGDGTAERLKPAVRCFWQPHCACAAGGAGFAALRTVDQASVNHCLIHNVTDYGTIITRLCWRCLHHQHRNQLLFRVDPKGRAPHAHPVEASG